MCHTLSHPLLPKPGGCCGVPPSPQPSSLHSSTGRSCCFPALSSRPASRFPQEPAVPGSQNGNRPEIVTAGLQCLLDITSASCFWAEPGPCLSFPPSEGIPRPWSGAAAPCFPANPGVRAGRRGGNVRGWHCACCQWLWPCLGVLGVAQKVKHAALTLLFPLRDAVSPKYPRFGTLFLLCSK